MPDAGPTTAPELKPYQEHEMFLLSAPNIQINSMLASRLSLASFNTQPKHEYWFTNTCQHYLHLTQMDTSKLASRLGLAAFNTQPTPSAALPPPAMDG